VPRGQIVRATRASGAIAITLLLAATIGVSASKSTASKAVANPRVAFLLPDSAPPWEGFDDPTFPKAMKKLYPGVSVDVLDASNNPNAQNAQAENEVTKGAKVLVVAAVDGKAFGVVAKRAIRQGVKVVAYDRLITGARISAYVSFNSVTVGHAMGAWMKAHTKHGARVAIINGSPADANAHYVNRGMLQVFNPLFNSGARKVVGPRNGTWTPGWDPSAAQREMEQLLTKNKNKVNAVLSANDDMAADIIAALKKQKLAGTVSVTGQDASLEGIQSIIRGYQGMTVFKDIRKEGAAAAAITNALLRRAKELPGINGRTPNGSGTVPSVVLPVKTVDYANLRLLVKNGWVNLPGIGGLNNVCKAVPKKSICK
jgi:D-xylose transport system substrate-binding protein